MNTFFQHKKIHEYTRYRGSLGQRSLTDFCIVSADLFSTVSDVRVKRGAELSTDHHLVAELGIPQTVLQISQILQIPQLRNLNCAVSKLFYHLRNLRCASKFFFLLLAHLV